MEYNSIRHKLNKYQNKLTLESNQYKKALYAEKVGHYRQMLQSGGNLASIISEGTIKLEDDVNKILSAFPTGVNLDQTKIRNLNTGIINIKDTFGTYIRDTLTATTNFAKYNSSVRDKLREILKSAKAFNPIEQDTIDAINEISGNLQHINIDELNFNQTIIGKLGVLACSSTKTSIEFDIGQLRAAMDTGNPHLNGNTGPRKYNYHRLTVEYATDVKRKLNELIDTHKVIKGNNDNNIIDSGEENQLKQLINTLLETIVETTNT